MTDDRRRHPRYEILVQLRVRKGRVNYIMEARNLSLSGVFVSTENLKKLSIFRTDQILEIDLFSLEDLDNLRLTGRIVRIVDTGSEDGQGFGVEFAEMDAETRQRLHELVGRAAQGSLHPPPLP